MFGKFQRAFFARYLDEADDGTGGSSGGGVTDDDKNKKPDDKGGEGDNAGDDGKKGGQKPTLTDQEAALLKENLKKKEKLEQLTQELSQAKDKLKEFEGLDAAEIKAMIAERKQNEERELEQKGDYERLKQRMADEHTKVVTGLQDQIKALSEQLGQSTSQINELTIGTQFNNSAYIKEKLILTPSKAKALYASHFEFENGAVVGYDKPRGAAGRTAFVDAVGNPLAFDEVVTKLVEADPEKDSLLRSLVKTGANSGNDGSFKHKKTADDAVDTDSLSKISQGLKGLKITP